MRRTVPLILAAALVGAAAPALASGRDMMPDADQIAAGMPAEQAKGCLRFVDGAAPMALKGEQRIGAMACSKIFAARLQAQYRAAPLAGGCVAGMVSGRTFTPGFCW